MPNKIELPKLYYKPIDIDNKEYIEVGSIKELKATKIESTPEIMENHYIGAASGTISIDFEIPKKKIWYKKKKKKRYVRYYKYVLYKNVIEWLIDKEVINNE